MHVLVHYWILNCKVVPAAKLEFPQPEFSIALHMNTNLKCKYVDIHLKLKSCLNIYWYIASFPEQESSHTSLAGLLSHGAHDLLEAILMPNARLAALHAWLVMSTMMPPSIISQQFHLNSRRVYSQAMPNPYHSTWVLTIKVNGKAPIGMRWTQKMPQS